uniref:Uncharacterized protein n=1 Tax=Paenibacillus polymyxa TaxID=1406 RepID=A0AAE9ID93_PAEPO
MNEENRPFSRSADAEGAKANFDANQRKLHSEECLAYGVRSATC